MNFVRFATVWATVLCALSLSYASDRDLDPEYRDERIRRLHRVWALPGALQIYESAVNNGTNDWDIKVELVELSGRTASAVEANWNKLLVKEHAAFLSDLKGLYPDSKDLARNPKFLTAALAKKVSSEYDVSIFIQEGDGEPTIEKWILDELLTYVGRVNSEFQIKRQGKKPLTYLRLHAHDVNSELIGQDLLIVRGVKMVLIVRLVFTHS